MKLTRRNTKRHRKTHRQRGGTIYGAFSRTVGTSHRNELQNAAAALDLAKVKRALEVFNANDLTTSGKSPMYLALDAINQKVNNYNYSKTSNNDIKVIYVLNRAGAELIPENTDLETLKNTILQENMRRKNVLNLRNVPLVG